MRGKSHGDHSSYPLLRGFCRHIDARGKSLCLGNRRPTCPRLELPHCRDPVYTRMSIALELEVLAA